MSKNVAVILSGCGFMDGAEIREAVITLLELDRAGAKFQIFAPDIEQKDVVNHVTGETVSESRNVLIEAARIARGDVKSLETLDEAVFDALVIPGGFGVAKNLSNVSEKGVEAEILPVLLAVIQEFYKANKPIGAICIAPAILAIALKELTKPTLTLGCADTNDLIEGAGGIHQTTTAAQYVVDEDNKLISCAAYMVDEPISAIAEGIAGVVNGVLERA